MTVLLVLPVGLLVGLSLGALGAGGSILTVPALVYLVGMDPHQATTASLVIVGATAAIGAVVHGRARRVRLGPGLLFGALGVLGSVPGSRLSAAVRPESLLLGFAGLMVVAAVAVLTRARRGTGAVGAAPRPVAGPPVPGHGARASRAVLVTARTRRGGRSARAMTTVAAAGVVGLLTGFFGVGGGFVVVPALVLVLGYDTATAVGTSLVVIAVNSAAALATRLGTGAAPLDWTLVGSFVAAAVAGVLLGNLAATRADPRRLTTAFATMLVAVAVYTATRSLMHG
jgi:hypothetical protein